MKLRILYTGIIAMLLLAGATFGELVTYGTEETSDSASASASGSNTPEYEEGEGDIGVYTTEAGWFQFYLEAYCVGWAKAVEDDGWVDVSCVAHADTDCTYVSEELDPTASWSRHFQETDEDWDVLDPDSLEDWEYFSAYSGVYAEFVVIAGAAIEEGSSSSGGATAYAYAYADLR